ncbi:MAG: Gfo/Idh/MocA family oxidoreductase [Gemmataceae bacterium]|nr:Gfo/Idh/MocA family oxidoreductase [Gemmataceae bacterium]
MSLPSRRTFVLGSTAAIVSFAHGADPAPSERLRVGAVGIDGQGFGDLRQIASGGAEVVALCDVHESRKGVQAQRDHFKKAKFHRDFRKMIEAGGLDAVMVATPDHTHYTATKAALEAGLHAFCEKPLTHTVQEARLIAELAKKKNRVTQMGSQIHASGNYRRVVEAIRSGVIGDVAEVHTFVGKEWGGGDRPKGALPVPAGLDWDLWLGPAPERPFNRGYVPQDWRRWWDFGGGTLNDMACHHMDLPFWALELRHPTHVKASGPPVHPEGAAHKLEVQYKFPARGKLPAVTLTWHDGGPRPAIMKEKGLEWGDGNLFIGSKGMMLADYGSFRLLPEADFKGWKAPKRAIPESVGHYKEWVQACKTGGATTCNFDYSGALTECVLLGTVSYRSGKEFDWDAKNLKASEAEAQKFVSKEYRKPWSA